MAKDLMTDEITNEVMLTVIDTTRALHDKMPTGMADVVLAALTAEPETLEELEQAIARYDKPIIEHGFLQHLAEGANETPWDAGVVIIDLSARLIVAETEPALYQPATFGFALYCPDPLPDWSKVPEDEIVWVRYRLSDDWLLVNSLENWQELAAARRSERAANPLFDARRVLFGEVCEFIASECLAAQMAGIEDPIAAIHEQWLMTPRDDLRGQTPRQVLLAQREFIADDLDSRSMQWSFTNECPLPLQHHSDAYRYAGLGTHFNVVYFGLVRYLIGECWQRMQIDKLFTLDDETTRLEKLKNDWLKENDEYGHNPESILEMERLRVPVTASSHELLIDHDCPLCQMAADPEFGPTFWHLDGSSMDLEDNWVFSFHRIRQEWEAEQREWQEFNQKFNEKEAQRRAEVEWAAGERIIDDRRPLEADDVDGYCAGN